MAMRREVGLIGLTFVAVSGIIGSGWPKKACPTSNYLPLVHTSQRYPARHRAGSQVAGTTRSATSLQWRAPKSARPRSISACNRAMAWLTPASPAAATA